MAEKYCGAPGPVHTITFTCDGLLHERSVAPMAQLEELHAEAGLAEVQPGVRASMGAAVILAQVRQWQRCAAGGSALVAAAGAAAAMRRRAGCWQQDEM